MPQYCYVPECNQKNGGHWFPKDLETRLKWKVAVRRLDPVTERLMEPRPGAVVCRRHFSPEDYKESLLGERTRLRKGAVPSIFSFRPQPTRRNTCHMERRAVKEIISSTEIDVGNEVDIATDDTDCASESEMNITDLNSDASTQCTILSNLSGRYSIDTIKDNPKAIAYYTGFGDFEHFMLFFNILGQAVYNLNFTCTLLEPRDQLFLCLMKLRQAKDDLELSLMFKVSESTVSMIVCTWINFMYYQLKEINIWPTKKVVRDTMPESFGNKFPNTRVILDATETPIQKPSNVNAQSMTFSTYKNKNTLKTMIGCSPRGLVTYISDSYAGSVSDRQIIERSELCSPGMLQKNDSIMADRGIMVQDLFAHQDVHVNTPTMLKGKSQLEPADVVRDRRIASKRIHIERVIGLSKTFKILKRDLSPKKILMGSKIVYICFMISNFRNSIVNRLA